MSIAPVLVFALLLAAPAYSQSPEAVALGAACLPEDPHAIPAIQQWHNLISRHAAETKAGNRQLALDLARQIVRLRCSNEHWWFWLAESYFILDRHQEAVASLQALYNRKSNSIAERLRAPGSPLSRLTATPAFLTSPLAAKLNAARDALEHRRTQAQARLASEPSPPHDYIARPACPFECCRFGTWSVTKATPLYDRPGGDRIVATAQPGQSVEARTGEVHLQPVLALVRSSPSFAAKPGDIVFLLDYLGEGHGNVWHAGKIHQAEILSVREECIFPGPSCWAEFVRPGDSKLVRAGKWWVQIQLRHGVTGWTTQTQNFSGLDGCG